MKKIILTGLEEELKELLEKIACGANEKIIHDLKGHPVFLTDYDGLSLYLGVSKQTLFDMLDHISRHDFAEKGAPMLEAQLKDIQAGMFRCPTRREGFYALLEEFYGTKITGDFFKCEDFANREEKRMLWYYRVSESFDEPFIKTLHKEHVLVSQEDLIKMCEKYMPAISLGLFRNKVLIDLKARYIVLDNKPYFGTASFGNFFFINDRMFVITHDEKLRGFRDRGAETKLFENADMNVSSRYFSQQWREEFADEETGNIVTIEPYKASEQASGKFKAQKLFAAEVLFAGTQTDIWLRNTKEYAYTGDAVTLKKLENNEQITLPLCTQGGQYTLVADNHSISLPPTYKCAYYKAGSVFYDLSMMMHTNNVFGCCVSFAQSRSTRKIQRLRLKHSPCYAQEDLK